MGRPILRLFLLLAVCITMGLVLWDGVPLGVPGEWTWDRADAPLAALMAGVSLAAMAGAVYVGFVMLGARRIDCGGPIERRAWLTALLMVAFAWLWAALDSSPPPLGYARVPWVLYYPRSSGYFWQARYDVESTGQFLAGYEELLAERDFLHIGTHPPGLTLGYRGLLEVCQRLPALTNAVIATQPLGVREGIETIRANALSSDRQVTPADEACLWLAALLVQFSVVFTTIALYGLAARHHNRRIAWLTAGLWPLVPAIAVFFPKSDVMYALPATLAAWLWLTACDRQSLFRAVAAGLVFWLGMMLSLAFITVMALVGAMTLWEALTRRSSTEAITSRFLSTKLVIAASSGLMVPIVVLAVAADINLLNVWSWNLSNHALFYEHNVRTWWKWLLVNPLELSFAVGLPVVCLAVVSIGRLMRSNDWRTPRASAAIAFLGIWGLLWLSAKNMGEAARLWILIMPWVVLMTADGMSVPAESKTVPSRRSSLAAWVLIAQLIAGIVTMMQVDGFHFAELLAGSAR